MIITKFIDSNNCESLKLGFTNQNDCKLNPDQINHLLAYLQCNKVRSVAPITFVGVKK